MLRGGVLVGYGQVLPTVSTTDGSITGYTWTYQESELNNGTYAYTARIVDGAGNLGTASSSFSLTVNQPLDVNDITVNEASAYAVFTVTGTASSNVALALTAVSATSGTDYAATFKWSSDGTTWNDYSSGVALSGFTTFYVRTAITNDASYEGPESFTLTASSGGASVKGTATIRDDGTGAVYTGTVTSGTPDTSGTADDDRTVSVTAYSTPVNEASDYAFFTVSGVGGELIKLDVLDGNDSGSLTARIGTAPSTYYSLNSGLTWTAYTGSAITMPSGGSFKVRVDITAEQDTAAEGSETFQLKALYSTNTAKSASAEVAISDANTGDIYLPDGSLDSGATKDYDIAAPTQTVVISTMEKDTGTSSTDFITKDGTATRAVTGTISAALGTNEVVQVSFDGGTTWSTATTTGTSWTINDPSVHSGNWVIKARVTNTTSSGSGPEASQSVTLDTSAPAPTITLDASVTTDDTINSAEAAGNVTIGGAVGGDAKAGDTVTLTINGSTYTGTVSSGRFSISVPGSALVADSDKVIDASISVTDTAGNTGTGTDTEGYGVDTTAPAPTVALNEAITADDVINAAEAGANVTITGTVGGDAKTGDTVTLTINGKTFTGTVSSGGFSISVPGSDLVADSDKSIAASISSADAAGNTGTGSDSEGYSVDTVAPLAPSLDLVAASDSGTSSSDDKTSDATPTIRVTLNQGGAAGTPAVAGDVVKLKIGSTEVGSATLVAGDITAGYVDITASSQSDGNQSFTAVVVDAASNSSPASTALPVLIDTTAPALASAAVSGSTLTLRYSDTGSGLGATTPAAGDYTVTYGANNTAITVSSVAVNAVNDTVTLTLASAIAGTATDIKVSYTPGTNPVEDVAGNDAGALSGQAVTNASSDTTAPTITGSTSISINENTTAVQTYTANETVTWSLEAGEDAAKFHIDHTTGALTFVSAPDYETPTDTSTSGSNTYLVRVKATDLAGNAATKDVTVTVLDVDEVLTVSGFDMTDATDSGSSQTDEYTSNGLPVLTFSGEANLTLTLKGPDNTVLTQGTHYSVTYASGVYTVTLLDAVAGGTANPFGTYSGGAATGNPAATADGTYTLSATDAANNSGTVGTFEINTAAPSKTTTILRMDKDTAASSDFITTDGSATRTVSGRISAPLSANEVLEVSFDGGATWSTATTNNTAWTINDPGQHNSDWVIKARVVNNLNGVSGTAAAQAVTLETTAPGVTSSSVNEASPYLVWTVTGTAGQKLALGLSGTASGNGVDYSGALQVRGTGNWVDYNSADLPVIPAGGSLKVRTALVDDAVSDSGETVVLTATTLGGQVGSGTNTILDQGNGAVNDSDGATANRTATDDRPAISVSSLTVQESASYAVTSISLSQPSATAISFTPSLAAGTATLTSDFGPGLEYFDGTAWQSAAGGITIPAGKIAVQVRTPIAQDALDNEGTERFSVQTGVVTGPVRNASGASGTISIADAAVVGNPRITDVTETDIDPTPNDLLTADTTQVVTVTGTTGGVITLYRLGNGQSATEISSTLFTVTENAGTYTLDFRSNALQSGEYAAKLTKGGTTSGFSNSFIIDSTPGLYDIIARRETIEVSGGVTIINGAVGGLDQTRLPTFWTGTEWKDADGEILRFSFTAPTQFNKAEPPAGATVTATANSGSTLELNTKSGQYTYTPAANAKLDTFTIYASDGTKGDPLRLTFDARDTSDRDGISGTVESRLASLVRGAGNSADLNNDGIADASQNAVTTLAWTTVDKFSAGLDGTLTDTRPIISVQAMQSATGTAVDESAQLFDVKVLPSNSAVVGGSKPAAATWDPIQFSVESTQSVGLVDTDPARAGTQTRVVIDISNTQTAAGTFTRYMKYVDATAVTAGVFDLDNQRITAPGWYDFTQRTAGGDGARFITAGGIITGIELIITDNAFGDNDPTVGRIFDPGVPVSDSGTGGGTDGGTGGGGTGGGDTGGGDTGGGDPAPASDTTPPLITGPSGPAGAASSAKAVPENTLPVTQFSADEPVTWSIDGGTDAALFTIDPSTGALVFKLAPDFERPGDAGADNVYQLSITATDLFGNASSQTVSVTVTDIDEAKPIITGPSNPPGATDSARSIPENTTPVTTFTANEPVRWTITGGPDAALFLLDPASGALSFKTAPDFERPGDIGADNVYNLTVTATDTAGLTSAQNLAVTVSNLIEVQAIYTAPSASGDQLLYRTQDEAQSKVASGASTRIDFYGTTEPAANAVPLKAWQNLITGDVFYAPADKAAPYDCYVEVAAQGLPQVLKAGTGAFDVHLYLNSTGMTQLVGVEAAKSLNLAAQGYVDMGALFASAAPLGLAAASSVATFG